jgi:hypothetical protein
MHDGDNFKDRFLSLRKDGHGEEAGAGVYVLQMKRWKPCGSRILPELTKAVGGERGPKIGHANHGVVRNRDPRLLKIVTQPREDDPEDTGDRAASGSPRRTLRNDQTLIVRLIDKMQCLITHSGISSSMSSNRSTVT